MGWADAHVTALVAGHTVSFRPTGNSMTGKISSGQLCTVAPVTPTTALVVGDVVLCRVHGMISHPIRSPMRAGRARIVSRSGARRISANWLRAT